MRARAAGDVTRVTCVTGPATDRERSAYVISVGVTRSRPSNVTDVTPSRAAAGGVTRVTSEPYGRRDSAESGYRI